MSVLYDITAENLSAAGARVLHAGDDYEHDFVFQQGGAVLDLTGATIWLTIKENSVLSDAEAKLQLVSTQTDEIEITDAPNGKLTVKFSATGTKSTAGLEGLWPYDVKVKMASGKIHRQLRGVIEFLPNITRAIS